MRLYFLLTQRVPPVPSPVLLEVFDILKRIGFHVESGIAEEILLQPDHLAVAHDLYLLKSHTELSLSLAGVLHGQGARMLNPYLSCITTQDKIIASQRLRAADVSVPQSWVTGELDLLRPIIERHPLIIKPYRGHRGAGIHIVRTVSELEAIPEPETPVIIQEYIPGTGEDLKVYVVGENVFAVRKTFSSSSFTEFGRPCPVSPEVREMAQRVGRALGLGLYGLDVIESPKGPVVVDVNYFPGYKGVPDIAPVIAQYIEEYANGNVGLNWPSPASAINADNLSSFVMFNMDPPQ